MAIIGILIAIIALTIVIALVVGGIYLIVRKKSEAGAPEHPIQFHEILVRLLQLSLLVTNVFALMTIVFVVIDRLFPDLLTQNNMYRIREGTESLHTAIALLAVTLPASLAVTLLMRRMTTRDTQLFTSPVRKYGIGMTLVVSALAVCGAIFSIVFQFLQGELSSRFLTKALSVLVIGGSLFWYYRYLFHATREQAFRIEKLAMSISALVLLAAAIYGIALTGSPAEIRREKFDDRRLSDLSQIQSQVLSYWQTNRKLPENLASLTNALSYFAVPTDPKTKTPYEYHIITQSTELPNKTVSGAAFELCATFETVRKVQGKFEGIDIINNGQQDKMIASNFDGYYIDQETPFWNHSKGRHCFERTIDPKIFTPILPLSEMAKPTMISVQ